MEIKIDFTSDDLKPSKPSFEPLPKGEYVAAITKFEVKKVKAGQNEGKPYFALELTIQDGEYEGRKLWSNVMAFSMPNGNFSLANFLRACGMADCIASGKINADPDNFLGTIVTVAVKKVKDTWRMAQLENDDDYDGETLYKNEIAAWIPATENSKAESKDTSLLPL